MPAIIGDETISQDGRLPSICSCLSQILDQSIVFGVRADEIPDGRVASANTNCPPVEADAHREDRSGCVDLLELQAAVPRVRGPEAVGFLSLSLDGSGRSASSFRNRLVVREITPRPAAGSRRPRTRAMPHRPARRVDPGMTRTTSTTAAPISIQPGEKTPPRPALPPATAKPRRTRVPEARSCRDDTAEVPHRQRMTSSCPANLLRSAIYAKGSA